MRVRRHWGLGRFARMWFGWIAGCLESLLPTHCSTPSWLVLLMPLLLQAAMDMLSGRLVTVRLNGFVFFGSANTIGQRLQEVGTAESGGDG